MKKLLSSLLITSQILWTSSIELCASSIEMTNAFPSVTQNPQSQNRIGAPTRIVSEDRLSQLISFHSEEKESGLGIDAYHTNIWRTGTTDATNKLDHYTETEKTWTEDTKWTRVNDANPSCDGDMLISENRELISEDITRHVTFFERVMSLLPAVTAFIPGLNAISTAILAGGLGVAGNLATGQGLGTALMNGLISAGTSMVAAGMAGGMGSVYHGGGFVTGAAQGLTTTTGGGLASGLINITTRAITQTFGDELGPIGSNILGGVLGTLGGTIASGQTLPLSKLVLTIAGGTAKGFITDALPDETWSQFASAAFGGFIDATVQNIYERQKTELRESASKIDIKHIVEQSQINGGGLIESQNYLFDMDSQGHIQSITSPWGDISIYNPDGTTDFTASQNSYTHETELSFQTFDNTDGLEKAIDNFGKTAGWDLGPVQKEQLLKNITTTGTEQTEGLFEKLKNVYKTLTQAAAEATLGPAAKHPELVKALFEDMKAVQEGVLEDQTMTGMDLSKLAQMLGYSGLNNPVVDFNKGWGPVSTGLSSVMDFLDFTANAQGASVEVAGFGEPGHEVIAERAARETGLFTEKEIGYLREGSRGNDLGAITVEGIGPYQGKTTWTLDTLAKPDWMLPKSVEQTIENIRNTG